MSGPRGTSRFEARGGFFTADPDGEPNREGDIYLAQPVVHELAVTLAGMMRIKGLDRAHIKPGELVAMTRGPEEHRHLVLNSTKRLGDTLEHFHNMILLPLTLSDGFIVYRMSIFDNTPSLLGDPLDPTQWFIWWTDLHAVNLIEGKPKEKWPLYVLDQWKYRLKLEHGKPVYDEQRLYIDPKLGDQPQTIDPSWAFRAAQGMSNLIIGRKAQGIVIHAKDLARILTLDGAVSDLNLELVTQVPHAIQCKYPSALVVTVTTKPGDGIYLDFLGQGWDFKDLPDADDFARGQINTYPEGSDKHAAWTACLKELERLEMTTCIGCGAIYEDDCDCPNGFDNERK